MRNIGAVILAAGESSRFGEPKQLLTFRGETLVGRAVRAAALPGKIREEKFLCLCSRDLRGVLQLGTTLACM